MKRLASRLRGSVVLLSGGIDSATCLALACRDSPPVHALTVVYGQRHEREIRSARTLAQNYGLAHHSVVRLPIGPLLDSSLTDRRRAVPRHGTGRTGRIPSTYVPARNTILLAIALGYAESHRLERIYIGINAVDYSGYPDCRPEYLRAFQRLARLATRVGTEGGRPIRVFAPLLHLSKEQIIRRGNRLGVPWQFTWSCYRGGRRPCGTCDSCVLRARGFARARTQDPSL